MEIIAIYNCYKETITEMENLLRNIINCLWKYNILIRQQ
jgi:hypothetical protein